MLDVASGSGVVAIAAAKCGARVTATEIDENAIAAIRLNAVANDTAVDVHLGDVLDDRADADVIVAGDVFYSRDMTVRILSFLDRAEALVLVGDPGRAYAPATGFDRVAEYEVPVSRDLESSDRKHTYVLRATAGSGIMTAVRPE